MDDPVVGGYTPEKIALRRAIALGYDRQAEIDVLRYGQGKLASQLVPPGIPGHDPALAAKNRYDPATATATARHRTANSSRSPKRRHRTRPTATKTSCGKRAWTLSASGSRS